MSERKLTGVIVARNPMLLDLAVQSAERCDELCCNACGVTISRWGSYRFDEESGNNNPREKYRATFFCSIDCTTEP